MKSESESESLTVEGGELISMSYVIMGGGVKGNTTIKLQYVMCFVKKLINRFLNLFL